MNEAVITDPVDLEVWRHLLAAVTEEMGTVLTRSAFSPNIKERRDLSCALFAPNGEMAAHAAHIPVHLGSTPIAVEAVLSSLDLGPGDMALVNDPYQGGTHLPDMTIVAPVHAPAKVAPGDEGAHGETVGSEHLGSERNLLIGYVVNRAHHADVGGTAAGSMALARHIDDEGVRVPPRVIVRGGRVLSDVLRDDLYRHVRTPEEREGDLLAQLAAARVGIERLKELAGTYGAASLNAAMLGLVAHADRMMRAEIADLPNGRYEAVDFLDDDGISKSRIPIRVAVTIEGDRATIDFTGSAPAVVGPLNAVRAVTVSAVLYALRCIAPEEVPASTGLLAPVRITTPKGSIVDAVYPAPVAAGNVETSQRIVDVLFAALAEILPDRIPAASQGTMNNITMGGGEPRPWAYYETLGGGTGAGPGFHGESAIHSHMTNTLNTPIEALEHSCPMRIRSFSIRRGSGGAGVWRGGEGLERVYELLASAEVSLLSERRSLPPPGAAGGAPGAPGEHLLIHRGVTERLPAKTTFQARKGDSIIVRTPGGGGFGQGRRPGYKDPLR